jgi:SAM-dependent methyltransferase
MGRRRRSHQRRGERAIERQLEFMRGLARSLEGQEAAKDERLRLRAERLREKLAPFRAIGEDDRVLEVGSGATGYIFHLGLKNAVGVDPLADHCRKLFPLWQSGTETLAAPGEALPFGDGSFDIVICDNVVDHAENPHGIVAEIIRVLKPGGLLYFTVHVHHPVYHLASTAYGLWRSLRLPPEVTPFADHTVHLTPSSARKLLAGQPVSLEHEAYIDEARQRARHLGDRLKRLWYKNRMWEVIALRGPSV